jgi:N-acyl-D-aspartate/D-glutamate deacylase
MKSGTAARTVLRGGTIIDGTGAPARRADLAMRAAVIEEIGPGLDGDDVLDVSGLVVTPGFIDIHTHYDAQVFWDPRLTPSCHHGVTTVIAGNCGFSIAPCGEQHTELLARTLHHVEDMSVDTLAVGVPWEEFETFPEYLDAVRRRGVALNFGCYIGHTALRIWAMGEDAYERDPTSAELEAMTAAVREALDAGAMGFATSHSPTHNGDGGRPVPSRRASMDEVLALATPLREADRGVVALLPGDGMDHDDPFVVWEAIRRPVTWTALLTVKGFPWHEEIIRSHDEHRLAGARVWPQVSGRPLVFQMTMADPFTFNMRESFQDLMDRPVEDRIGAPRHGRT